MSILGNESRWHYIGCNQNCNEFLIATNHVYYGRASEATKIASLGLVTVQIRRRLTRFGAALDTTVNSW